MDIPTFINEAKLNELIEIKEHNYIKSVKFFYTISENWYSWQGETTSNYGNRIIYPYKTSQDILTFKTLNGAKRNFVKQYLAKDK